MRYSIKPRDRIHVKRYNFFYHLPRMLAKILVVK